MKANHSSLTQKMGRVGFSLNSVVSEIQSDAGEPLIMATHNDIVGLLEGWIASLRTGRPEKVVANYAEEAILIPTLSSQIRHTHSEIREYFEHFLQKEPEGRVEEQNIRIYGEIAINSGLYTFAVKEDGAPKEVRARFTFVYHRFGAQWLIVEHHSSLLP